MENHFHSRTNRFLRSAFVARSMVERGGMELDPDSRKFEARSAACCPSLPCTTSPRRASIPTRRGARLARRAPH
jgi:hypothetical protein